MVPRDLDTRIASILTRFRVVWTDGSSPSEHETLEAATEAVRTRCGWEQIVLSDSFAVGQTEGSRGSVYGYECYESDEALAAHPDGDAFAPRILRIRGDEAWAMGCDDDEARS
jgi:hypothetical protein